MWVGWITGQFLKRIIPSQLRSWVYLRPIFVSINKNAHLCTVDLCYSLIQCSRALYILFKYFIPLKFNNSSLWMTLLFPNSVLLTLAFGWMPLPLWKLLRFTYSSNMLLVEKNQILSTVMTAELNPLDSTTFKRIWLF